MNSPAEPTPSRETIPAGERLPLISKLQAQALLPRQKLLRLGASFLAALFFGCIFLLLATTPVTKADTSFVVTKFAPTQVKAGESLTYTIRVINTSSLNINVDITDPIPAGMTVTNPGSGVVSGGAIKWTNLSIAPFNSVDVVFVTRVTLAGTVVNSDYEAVSGAIIATGPPVTTTVVPNNPANVAIQASPNPVEVGNSTVITVSVTDAYGNNVVDSTMVSLTSSMGTIDGQPPNTTIQGTTTAGKMVKTLVPGTVKGTAALTATSGSVQGNGSVTIDPGPPAAMTVTASPTSISVVGNESSTITATITDQYGNAVNPTSVTFSTSLGSLNNQGSSVAVTSSNGQATATLKGTVTGVANLTVSAGSLVDNSKSVTLMSGPPAELSLTASPTSIVANGVSTSTLTLTMRDQNSNLVNRSVPVTITTTAGQLTGGGQSYYQTTSTGQVMVALTSITQATLANVQATAGGLNTDIGVNFVPGEPAKITLDVTPTSVYANGSNTTQLKATVMDVYNNLVSEPASVTFAAAEGTIVGGATGSTTNGIFSRNLQTNTTLGTIPLTVTVAGLITPTYGSVEFVTGPPHNALITLNPTSPITVGTPSQMTITVRDSANHPLAGIPISFATTKGTITPASSGTTDSNGKVQVTLSSTQSGSASISVTGPSGPLVVNGGSISFVAAAPAQATISANPTEIVADNVSISQISVVVVDQYGNPVPNFVPNFTTTLGTLSGSDATNSAGTTTRVLQAGTTLGTATISISNVPAVTNATVDFVTGPPALATLSATPSTATVGQNISLSITVKDSIGHPIVGQTLSVTSSFGTVSNCTATDAQGVLTCTLYSTKSGQPTISVAGILATGTTITYNPGDLDHIGITPFGTQSVPVAASAGVTKTFSAVGQDVYNNTVSVTGFVWETTSFGGTGSINSSTGQFVGALAGLVRIKANAGGKTGVSYVNVGPGTPAKGTVSAAPLSVPANGTSVSNLAIAVTDAYGNPVGSGHTVNVTSSIGIIEGTNTTSSSGVVNRTIRSTQAGVATISATGLTLSGDTSITFTPGSPTKARVVASATSIPANGVAQSTLSITLQDQFNNPVGSGFAPTIQTSLGTLSGSGNTNSSGTLTRTLTAPTVAGTASFTVKLGGTPLTVLGDTVSFVVGPLSQIKVTPAGPASVPAGEPTVFTAQAYDANNAPIPSGITYGWELYCNGTGCGSIDTIFGQQVTFTGQDAGTGIELIASGDEDGSFYDKTVDLTVLPGAPTEATIVASSAVITADGTSPITFTLTNLLDDFGNTAADGEVITVTLQAEPTPVVNSGLVSGGQVEVVLTSTTKTGTYPISATTYLGEINLSGDTSITFVPGLPAQAQIVSVTPPQIVADGVNTGSVVLQVEDAQGNSVSSGLSLVVTSTLGSISGGAATDSQGRLTRTIQAGLIVGEAQLYVDGFAVSGPGVPFVPGPPYAATVTVVTSTLAAGGDTTPVIFDVRDQWNHPVADGTTITPTLTPAYGTFSLTDPAVGGLITQTLTSATSVGTATLSVSGLSLSGDTTVTFIPGPAAKARVSANPTSFTVGAGSSALSIAVTDAYDNIVPPTAITMTAGLGTFDGGGSTVNKITANGSGLITANLASLVAGTEVFTFTGPAGSLSLHPASDEITFLPAAPVTVVIDPSGPLTLTAGVPVTLTSSSLDQYGNAVDPWNPVTYSWFQTATTGQPGYGTITAHSSQARSITFRPELVGANQVWNSGGVTNSNPVTLTVVAGPAATATVAINPASVVANGLSTYQVTLTNVTDAFGNAIPDGTPLTVTVQAGSPVVKSGVVSGGAMSLTMSSNTDAGTHPLLVEGAGGALTLSGQTTMTFDPGPPARAEITATPTTLPGDGTSTASLLVKVYDTNLNLVSDGLPITVTTSLGTISGNGTTANGQVIRTLHAPSNLGTATFTVTGPNGQLFVVGDTVTFVAGGPIYASLTAAPAKVLADGVSTSQLQITIKDGNGFTVQSSKTVVLSVTRGTITPATTVASAGVVTSTFTAGTTTGLAGLTVTYDGVPLQVVGDSLELIPGFAVSGTLTASPTQLIVGSSDQSALTINLVDSWGHPVADGTVVTVTTSLGTLAPSSGTTTAGGVVTRTLTVGLTQGTASFTVTVGPDNSPLPLSSDTVQFVAGPLDHIAILPATAVQVTAGDQIALSAIGYDAYENVVSNGPFTWKKWSGSGAGTLSSSGVFTGTRSGSVGIQASLGTTFSPVKPVTIVPGAPFTATVQASPLTIPVGGATSQLTITAWDAYGNLVADGTILNVTTNLGTLTGSGTTLNGVLTRTLVSGDFFGQASLFVNGWEAGGDKPVFSPGVQVTASPDTLVADGVSQSILTIELFDNQGEPVADGLNPTVTTTLGTISGSGSTVNGILTRTLRAPLTVGTANIYVDGVLAAGQVKFTVGPAARADISANPTMLLADGVSKTTLKVRVYDAYGHLLTNAGTVALSTTKGKLSGSGAAVNGVTTRQLTASSSSGTAILSAVGLSVSGNWKIHFVGDLTDQDFESGNLNSWTVGGVVTRTGTAQVYTATVLSSDKVGAISVAPLSGGKMVRLGATSANNTAHEMSEAWLSQPVYVEPEGVTQITFWYRILSYDVSVGSAAHGYQEWDPFEVYLNGKEVLQDGIIWDQDWQNWHASSPSSPKDMGWKQGVLDLTPYGTSAMTASGQNYRALNLAEYAGQTVTLEFRVPNRQAAIDNTWVYLDDLDMVHRESVTQKVFLPLVVR